MREDSEKSHKYFTSYISFSCFNLLNLKFLNFSVNFSDTTMKETVDTKLWWKWAEQFYPLKIVN